MELVSAYALLRAANQVYGLQELMERNAAVLENRTHLDRKLLAAVAALVKANANPLGRVSLDLADAIHAAAMRADRAVRPQHRL
jgi:hypothetical protein